jgi:hypothetical protein
MQFDIYTYINNLPDNIERLNLSFRELEYIPDLTRFKSLKYIKINFNNLTILPKFNNNIK